MIYFHMMKVKVVYSFLGILNFVIVFNNKNKDSVNTSNWNNLHVVNPIILPLLVVGQTENCLRYYHGKAWLNQVHYMYAKARKIKNKLHLHSRITQNNNCWYIY